ncbi:MAG: type II secretion system minor pseudopilin GspK, partial [Pseudomonadales bacterium]
MTSSLKDRQGGVALVTVMIVVAAAVVLGVQMTTEQTLAVSRAGNFIRSQQAMEYAIGGEELARQILAEDQRISPGKDHLAEVWASSDLQYEFEEGAIRLQITDLSGRLNINSLRAGDGLARTRFENLARELGVDPVFVHRLADWVDEDDAKSNLGAEDFDYLGLERPYRTAGRPIPDVSELRLLLEMDNATFEGIEPYITAIPDPDTIINVNTAPARVIKAIAPELSLEMAEGLVAQRDQQEGYNDIESFIEDP